MQIASIAAATVLNAMENRKRHAGDSGFVLPIQVDTATGDDVAPATKLAATFEAPTAISRGDKLNGAMAAFQRETTMTPLERARRDVLKEKLLTENQIQAMSPDDREKTEMMIAEEVMKRLRLPEPVRTDQQVTLDAILRQTSVKPDGLLA